MKIRAKFLKWFIPLALGLLVLTILIGTWLVPALLVSQIRKHYDGFVTIRGWWIGRRSAGVTGLTLHEGRDRTSPVWATAGRVATDLSLGTLLRGRTTPRRIVFRSARVLYRIDARGAALTHLPLKRSAAGRLPELDVEDGRLTFRQDGRPEMAISRISAVLEPDAAGPRFRANSEDARWGRPKLAGRFAPEFSSVRLRLDAEHLVADRYTIPRIPFVPTAAWSYFDPAGPVAVELQYERSGGQPGTPSIRTTVTCEGTRIHLPHLDLFATGTTGRITYADKIVRLENLRGELVGGRVHVSGPMDFSGRQSRYDLALGLQGVDAAALPRAWGLDRLGITGRLTGSARLLMTLTAEGLDLTGSAGQGSLASAVWKGIPLGQLGLVFRGEGLRAIEAPRGPFRPQWIGSDLQIRNVELRDAPAHLGTLTGTARHVPVSGRLTLDAHARIPLGTLSDLASCTVRGSALVAGASVGGVAIPRLQARVGMANGVLELDDLRGRLADPRATPTGHIGQVEAAAASGSLLPGEFGARLRLELGPTRRGSVKFDGRLLPIESLAALASTGLAPVSGRLTLHATARAEGADLVDPPAWSLWGHAEAPDLVYRELTFTDVSTGLAVERGRFNLTGLRARLGSRALRANLDVGLAVPHAFKAELDTDGMPIADLVALAPRGVVTASIAGTIAGRAEAWGALEPWRIASRGQARIHGLAVGRVVIGELPLAWSTERDTVVLSARELSRYGGLLAAQARIPTGGDRAIEGTVMLSHVDTAQLMVDAPGSSVAMTGRADGQARFRFRPGAAGSTLDADARLTATTMTVRGIPARSVRAVLTVHDGVSKFDVAADGLGGDLTLKGDAHLGADLAHDQVSAQLRADQLHVFQLLGAIAPSWAASKLQGRASAAVNVRTHLTLADLEARGSAELRDLTWGEGYRLGDLRARLVVEPRNWKLGPLEGELFGSALEGSLGVEHPRSDRPRYHFDLRMDRISLARLCAFAPDVARKLEGFAKLRCWGESEGSFRGLAELRGDRARVNHLPLTELLIPAEWSVASLASGGGAVRVQGASARLAGGHISAAAHAQLGRRRDFQASLIASGVDVRVLSKAISRSRPTPGRISGVATLHGLDFLQPDEYRGKIDLDLVDTSLVDVPILEALESSVGAASGGVFHVGDVAATIAHRKIHVNRLTLVGSAAQLHATGTIGFDLRLDLEVLVNTNDIISEGGQALVGRLPNAAAMTRRREQAIEGMANYFSTLLKKYRITGTVHHPIVTLDQSLPVGREALAFFREAVTLRARAVP